MDSPTESSYDLYSEIRSGSLPGTRAQNRNKKGHKSGSLGDYATREAARHTVNSLTQDVKVHASQIHLTGSTTGS